MEPKPKIVLAVLFGGKSSEHEISCLSVAGVLAHLDPIYEPVCVGITKEGVWYLYTGDYAKIPDGSWETDTEHLIPAILSPCPKHHGLLVLDKEAGTYTVRRIDCILPIVHGENCEDGKLQGLLDLSGVPFVGCRTRASAVTMDKITTKLILQNYGIPQASWVMAYARELEFDLSGVVRRVEEKLPYPVFVKPSGAGSSYGVNRARDRAELEEALKAAAQYDQKILIEEAICGKEVETAVIDRDWGGKPDLYVSPCGEIRPDGEFYDFDAKYVKNTSVCQIPAEISEEAKVRVRALAAKIFRLLDCRGLARVDCFVDGDKVVFNEINTIPGFTPISMFPKLFEYAGTPYELLIKYLVHFANKWPDR